MLDRLKRLIGRTPLAVPDPTVTLGTFHADYWGCGGHEVQSRSASVSGGLFAVWHFPPVKGRGVGAYTTWGIGPSLGVEFLCLSGGVSTHPFDDPFARLLMEAGLFKSKERPVLATFDVIPLAEDTLPGSDFTHALYAPPGRFFNVEELEKQSGFKMVLVVPITREELHLIPTTSAEAFVDAMVADAIEPRADRDRFVRSVVA